MNLIQNFISEDLIYALGWTMIHSLWQGMLVAFLMLLVFYSLQGKSAKIRYEIAGLSLFAVFICSLCTFTLYYQGSYWEESEMEFYEGIVEGMAPSLSLWEYYSQSATEYFNQHLPLFVTIWLVGVAFFLLRLVGGLVFIEKLKIQGNVPLRPYWQQKLRALLARMPIRRQVKLLESSLVNVPMVIGYFKPIILLPVGAVNNLSTREVEAILAHELAHIFRNDYLLNIIMSFIEVLFYYHPAVWIISAHIRSERENCADDIAVKLCGSSLTYARALVNLQQMTPDVPVFAMPFSGQKNQLLQRIQRILNQPQNRSNIMEKLTATGMLLIAILFLSVSSGKSALYAEHFPQANWSSWSFLHPLEEEEANDFTFETQINVINIKGDTIPDKQKRQRIVQTDNEGTIEVELTGDEISEIKIDGEVIAKEDYEAYEDVIRDLMENLPPTPPAPPTPPTPAAAPAAPNPPGPPAAPAPPAAPRIEKKIKVITTDKDDNGHTVIMINGEDGPMKISINGEEAIFIDGEALESGDSMIIVERFREPFFFHSMEPEFHFRYEFPEHFHENFAIEMDRLAQAMTQLGEEDQGELLKQMEELRALQEERFGEMQEAHEFHWRAQRDQMDEERARMEERRNEARARANEARARMHENRARENQNALVRQLQSDGYLNKGENYSIEFNHKRLKVNGEKLPDAIHQKYLDIFNHSEEESFNIQIQKN